MRWWARREKRLCPPYETCKHTPAFSRHGLPEVCSQISLPSKLRAQGMPGARCAPRSRVQEATKKRTRAYRSHRNHPALPAQWFTAYIVLTSATGLSCHRHPREAFASWEFDTSVGVSGPHDFARPPQARSSVAPSASTAARPANVTIAYRPFWWDGVVRNIDTLWVFCKSEYFCKKGVDRLLGVLPVGHGSRARRSAFSNSTRRPLQPTIAGGIVHREISR